MLRNILQILLLLPFSFSAVTIRTNLLFQNTLRRWGITPLNSQDRSERWIRFMKAKEAVEKTTTDVLLESLNIFTVLNDAEFEQRVKPLHGGFNITEVLGDMTWYPHERGETETRRKRSLPATFDYWEKEVGLSTPRDQMSCGSCWSFPNVGTMEALNKKLTGDDTEFSEQYFVDCTFSYSGCAGGTTHDGYKVTMMRQYILSAEDWPYTAAYKSCKFTKNIKNFKNNALDKIWVQSWIPLGNSESALLKGLEISPVAFGVYISENIFAYSGGTYSDALCATEAKGHSMLLVGYTEKTLRVKASYGTNWGDYGYINYKRDGNLDSCRFFKNAFILTATYRRELEYKYCEGGKVTTYKKCKDSCRGMNTDSKSGWELATIPTEYHNQLVMEMITDDYGAQAKKNDSFNYFWIGLVDEDKDETYEWQDSFTPVNYVNVSHSGLGGNKYGMISKITGQWITKNSLTFPARGLCSRPKNCWNIESAIKNGTVTFSNADLSEGTIATVKCKEGKLVGASSLKCVGGQWNAPLPACSIGGACAYSGEAGTRATITPNKLDFKNDEKITITCTDKDSTVHVCTDGAFVPVIKECVSEPISKTMAATLSIIVAVVTGLVVLI